MLPSSAIIFGIPGLFCFSDVKWLKFPNTIGLILLIIATIGFVYILKPYLLLKHKDDMSTFFLF